jgi:lipid A 3-O-deacylase
MMSLKEKLRIRCLLLMVLMPGPVVAQTLSFKVENDLLSYDNRDGHYSGGIEAFWSFEPAAEHWTLRVAESLPGWSAGEVDDVAYRFGYQIYTPNDIDARYLVEDDRPYAGLAFAGVSWFADQPHETWRLTREMHVDIGLVGPAVGAEKVQRGLHRVFDSSEPKGWRNQLRNEPFANLAYGQQWWRKGSFGGLELEYGPGLGLAVGNLYTYGSGGVGMRFGRRLDRSFGIPSVTPGQSGDLHFTPGSAFSWYGFVHLEGRYMAQNLLLDGNTFKSSHSVDRNEWVGDAKVGVVLTWSQWQVAFASVWRSHEFVGQRGHDQFGSLTISRGF